MEIQRSRDECVNGKWKEVSGRATFKLDSRTTLTVYKTKAKFEKRICVAWHSKVSIDLGIFCYIAYSDESMLTRDMSKAKGLAYDMAETIIHRLKENAYETKR